MHLGAPVVPDEYMMYSGWLNGSCSKRSSGCSSPEGPGATESAHRKSSSKHLRGKGRGQGQGEHNT